MCNIMNDLCIDVEIILYILSLCPSHDLSSRYIMADRDLSRCRIMASYILNTYTFTCIDSNASMDT